MPKARLYCNQVIREGHQSKRPREQDGSGDAVFQCECQPEKARKVKKKVVCLAHSFDEDAFLRRFGDAYPEEVETLEAVLNKPQLVCGNLLFGQLAFVAHVGSFAHLAVLLEDGADVADGNRRSPGKAAVFGENRLM